MDNTKELIGQRVHGKIIKWIRKVGRGYGFAKLKCDDDDITVIIHSSEIRKNDLHRVIHESNVNVSFIIAHNEKGYFAKDCFIQSGEQERISKVTEEHSGNEEQCAHEENLDSIFVGDRGTIFESSLGALIDVEDSHANKSWMKFYNFMEKSHSRQNSSSSSSISTSTSNIVKYISSMASLKSHQKDILQNDLFSNTSKGNTNHAKTVIENFMSAHQVLLCEAPQKVLTKGLLKSAHLILLDGLTSSAGQFRKSNARCGRESFTKPELIENAVNEWLVLVNGAVASRSDIDPATKAAWVIFRFLKIHPFSDGNGRTGRLLANWVLRREGIPFDISFCASPLERSQYTAACRYEDCSVLAKLISRRLTAAWLAYNLLSSRAIMSATVSSHGGDTQMLNGIVESYTFQRIGSTHDENEVCSDDDLPAKRLKLSAPTPPSSSSSSSSGNKQKDKNNEQEKEADKLDRHIKEKRESLRAEICLFCLDNNPSVCMICCGKPLHINCLSTWRSDKTRGVHCPHCRTSIDESVGEYSFSLQPNINIQSQSQSQPQQQASPQQQSVIDERDSFSTSSTTTTTTPQSSPIRSSSSSSAVVNNLYRCAHCNNKAAQGCNNNRCARCCFNLPNEQCYNCQRHGKVYECPTNSSTSDTSTSTSDTSTSSSDTSSC